MSTRQVKQLKMACIFCKSELKNLERAKCAAAHSDLLIGADGGETSCGYRHGWGKD